MSKVGILSSMPMEEVDQLVQQLELQPHPEGGYYREVHRSPLTIAREHLPAGPMGPYAGDRAAMTAIYFLLPVDVKNAVHRVNSEEVWVFLEGDPLLLELRDQPDDETPAHLHRLGEGVHRHAVVPAGRWQNVQVLPGEHGFALVMCFVAPGFDFDDFEMVDKPLQ
ncbi:MAG: cupin domain-containing protein [Phycisphaerales bacterium]|nr:MAG: cupin domain-containing protein [Phycisphaerales bacterium]